MLLNSLRSHVIGAVVGVLCVAVLCKKAQKDDTYGDLGDEIILDYPSRQQPSRKNEIPKGDIIDTNRYIIEQQTLMRNLMNRKRHQIEQRIPNRNMINARRNNKMAVRMPMRNKVARKTAIQNKLEHFVNPLYYREFIPQTHPYGVHVPPPSRRRNSIRINNQNTLRKKDAIYRPVTSIRPMGRPGLRPRAYPGHPGIPYFPRRASLPARRRLPAPKALTPRPRGRPPLALTSSLLPRTPKNINLQKLKHHLHVQIVPNAPLNPVGAKKLGIHSGLVLMPATAKQTVAQRARVSALRVTAAVNARSHPPNVRGVVMKHSAAPSRFSERKHIWIPSKNVNARARVHVSPMQVMTSYHMDTIGNLIPDRNRVAHDNLVAARNQAKRFKGKSPTEEDALLRNLGNVATRFSVSSPTLRRNMLTNPRWLDALKGAVTSRGLVHSSDSLRAIHRVVPLVSKQAPRRRVITKKPFLIRSNLPKSSKRILYFANGTPGKRFGNPNIRIENPNSRYHVANPPPPSYIKMASATKRYMYDPHKDIRRPHPEQNPGSAMVSKEYMIPQVSNKVYRYINDKTVPSVAARRLSVKNPLIKYLQYHRTHPTFDESALSRDVNPRKRDVSMSFN